MAPRDFVTLGMFIIDEFSYLDENGIPTDRSDPPQIGGGGTYAAIGARIWLSADRIGMVVDRGHDFPSKIQDDLDMAVNIYKGDSRGFEYLTPRIRITPRDLAATPLARPTTLHFICSPSRASAIMAEVQEVKDWHPTTIYEPIPDRCIPDELLELVKVLPFISILSPNAEEAHSLLSMALPPVKASIELAGERFIAMGVPVVIIRSGPLGAYVQNTVGKGRWVDAFWRESEIEKVVDVTGGGNSFLGGLAAGLALSNGDIFAATFYASISASFIIEQGGLPKMQDGKWNGESPMKRLEELRERHREGGIAERTSPIEMR